MACLSRPIGTYTAPAVTRGTVVTCLYRGGACRVTSATDAPIPWPRIQPLDQRGGSVLLVNPALERAIRTENAAALRRWFGVTAGVVWKWRRAFGVGRWVRTTKGSKRAIRAAAQKGGEAVKAKVWTAAELGEMSARSKRLGLRPVRWAPGRGGWTPAELALLGADHDEDRAHAGRGHVAAGRAERAGVLRVGGRRAPLVC